MFTFGEQLYRPTGRDEETLLVVPMIRSPQFTLAAASAIGTFDMPIPADRMLFLHSFSLALNGVALSTWTQARLLIYDRSGAVIIGNIWEAVEVGGLVGEGQVSVSGAGKNVNIVKIMQIALPPGIGGLRIEVTRSGTTNAVNWGFNTMAFTVPPGMFGRA